jgi:DNA polymerase I
MNGITGDRWLLVDGMSMLVRASKAAARMREPLSFNGTPTGTLLLFAQSLIKALSTMFGAYLPSHAVIAWEGIPQQNWRYQYYRDYRRSRSYPDGDDPSQETELAKEFCAAAGLHQSWSPQFEGDDIIAAWWRAVRSVQPGAPVIILSSDADLHQLCDGGTVCIDFGKTGDLWSDRIIEGLYGVHPADLPAMRALAGDPSDEIPGVRGVGMVRAASLVADLGTPELFLSALASLFPDDEGQSGRVAAYYTVSQLREPVQRPDAAWIYQDVYPEALWLPGKHYEDMRGFLERYGMRGILRRLHEGTLPWKASFPG